MCIAIPGYKISTNMAKVSRHIFRLIAIIFFYSWNIDKICTIYMILYSGILLIMRLICIIVELKGNSHRMSSHGVFWKWDLQWFLQLTPFQLHDGTKQNLFNRDWTSNFKSWLFSPQASNTWYSTFLILRCVRKAHKGN